MILRVVAMGAAVLVMGAVAVEPAVWVSPAAAAAKESAADRYRSCMAMVGTAPGQALALAEDWARAGGGDGAWRCAAAALVALERYGEAAGRLQMLADGAMDDPKRRAVILGQAANVLLLDGDSERAVVLLDEAVILSPASAPLQVDLARARADLGQYEQAVTALDAAIGLDPRNALAFALRASALRETGALGRAAADADEAVTLDGRLPEALLERGILRRLQGDDDGARSDWQRLLTVAPDSAAAEAARTNLARMPRPMEDVPARR
jgi:tetratricopeptide (TPR) repeat protein